jgi:hypothetical protein
VNLCNQRIPLPYPDKSREMFIGIRPPNEVSSDAAEFAFATVYASEKKEVAPPGSNCLFVQDNTQEGSVDVETAIVLNEAQLPEFVHEEVNPGAGCSDHFRQSLLRYFG